MSRGPARNGRAQRCVLAALLAAASVGWIGEGSSVAAAPAELISANPLSLQDSLPSVSGDGNIVVFTAVRSNRVWVRDRAAGTTTEVPLPAQQLFLRPTSVTTGGVLSRDGCHVAFWGFRPPTPFGRFIIPAQWYIYSWDRCAANSLPVLISTAPGFPLLTQAGDAIGPLAISADGRYVAYVAQTGASGPRIARIDTNAAAEDRLSDFTLNSANSIDISDDGAFVAIGGQTTISDISRNVVMGWSPPCTPSGEFFSCTTELISVGSSGQAPSEVNYNPSLSADGRFVAFTSNTPDIIGAPALTPRQVYVRDRVAGVTKLVSTSPLQLMSGDLDDPEISPDGSQIALVQAAAPSPGAKPVREVFVARSTSGFFDSAVFDLVSYGVSGAPTSQDSLTPSMSSNGRYVAFASGANNELSGTTMPTGLEVWMRERPIALDITPTIDFGTVDVGGQSPPQNAVITNTSGIAINIGAVTPPAAPFSITANGCGGVLQPGATCIVTMVFGPTTGGGASSSVTVSGDGLSVSSSLSGVGRSPNVPPPPPTAGLLTITPSAADYGSATVGTSLAAKKFVVSNPGQTAVPLAGVGLGGTGADQFAITNDGCGSSLAAGTSCTVEVVATVTREGAMSATLGVLGTDGQSAQATLRVRGTPVAIQLFTPTLKMNPGVVSAGEITVAIGTGFPPNIDVQLAFSGEAPFATVHTDAAGAFRVDYLLLRNGVRIGGREVIAIDQPQFSGVRAPLLIDLATYRPSGFSSPAFTSGLRSMFSRGG